MQTSEPTRAGEMVAESKDLSRTISALLAISRGLWQLIYRRNAVLPLEKPRHDFFIAADEYSSFKDRLLADGYPIEALLEKLGAAGFLTPTQQPVPSIIIKAELLRPTIVLSRLLSSEVAEHDLRAYIWRDLRTRFRCVPCAEDVELFFGLSEAANSRKVDSNRLEESSPEAARDPDKAVSMDYAHFEECLHEALLRIEKSFNARGVQSLRTTQQNVDLYVESCLLARYIGPHEKAGRFTIKTRRFDPDFMLSCLFGMPTGMLGFDNLFGGGGLSLPETIFPGKADQIVGTGRAVLIKGRFGCGKSLLALSLAAEVARKGGCARVIALEQSPDACLQMLASMGSLSRIPNGDVSVITSMRKIAGTRLSTGKGNLIVVGSSTSKEIAELLRSIEEYSAETTSCPLRLLLIDPMNSVDGLKASADVRRDFIEVIEEAKNRGVNVLMVAEETEERNNPAAFLSNIADTVIRLSVQSVHGYAQRYIEVEKSRLQREQRGKHPFIIRSGYGISIATSSAAVAARIRGRRWQPSSENVSKFGEDNLDNLLGKGAFGQGDVISLRGPKGTFKTELGILFSISSNQTRMDRRKYRPAVSLFISARARRSAITQLLNSPFAAKHRDSRQRQQLLCNEVIVEEARINFVHPGAIFDLIDQAFSRALAQGKRIERVVVDDIAHWETSCPFVREDETFGDTLVDVLRSKGATSLLICGRSSGVHKSVVQRSIVDSADVAIQTRRIAFRGVERAVFRIIKTKGMRHRQESFDVGMGERGLEISTDSALLRIDRSGTVRRVDCRLYLHHESPLQRAYNHDVLDSIKPVLSRQVTLNSKDRSHMVRAMRLNRFSTVDELQILQLDEFQAPELAARDDNSSALFIFANDQEDSSDWGQVENFIKDTERIAGERRSFSYVPYYQNIGLMTYRNDKLFDPATLSDWAKLAEECEKWERENDGVFFGFPHYTDENYNCLFFEVVFGLGIPRPGQTSACGLLSWLSNNRDRLIEACFIYRRLCGRLHFSSQVIPKANSEVSQISLLLKLLKLNQKSAGDPENNLRLTSLNSLTDDKSPVVWRHWYSTLRAQWDPLTRAQRSRISVCFLPRGEAVVGEWYLGVPSYSAAPSVGLKIIKMLTSRDAELERLQKGVGLPVRKSFYQTAGPLPNSFDLPTDQLWEYTQNAFRRSSLGCYSKMTASLAYHLKRIIEIPDPDCSGAQRNRLIREVIVELLDKLSETIRLLQTGPVCRKCSHQGNVLNDGTNNCRA